MSKRNRIFQIILFVFLILAQSSCQSGILNSFDEMFNSQPDQINIELDPYDLCVPERYPVELGIVIKVIDGDSIRVHIDGEIYEVRYIGMNAPEFNENTDPAAIRATNQNRILVDGKQVALYRDVSNTDRYGRLLRYVFIDGIFVNRELVAGGYAKARAYPPDIACHQVISGD